MSVLAPTDGREQATAPSTYFYSTAIVAMAVNKELTKGVRYYRLHLADGTEI